MRRGVMYYLSEERYCKIYCSMSHQSGVLQKVLSSFFRVKGVSPVVWKSHVVYKMSCDACNPSYIGRTANTLRERFIPGGNAHVMLNLIKNVNARLNSTFRRPPPSRSKVIILRFFTPPHIYNIDRPSNPCTFRILNHL